jgi:hypothetical protein
MLVLLLVFPEPSLQLKSMVVAKAPAHEARHTPASASETTGWENLRFIWSFQIIEHPIVYECSLEQATHAPKRSVLD